jgi:hypothetical protein
MESRSGVDDERRGKEGLWRARIPLLKAIWTIDSFARSPPSFFPRARLSVVPRRCRRCSLVPPSLLLLLVLVLLLLLLL